MATIAHAAAGWLPKAVAVPIVPAGRPLRAAVPYWSEFTMRNAARALMSALVLGTALATQTAAKPAAPATPPATDKLCKIETTGLGG